MCKIVQFSSQFRLNRLPPHYILKESNFRYVRLCDLDIPRENTANLFAGNGDPDQMLHSVASDLGLHCLGVSRLKWL